MSRTAQAWIGLVLVAGSAALAVALLGVPERGTGTELKSPALWILLIAACIAHAFPVVAARHQAYHTTQAFLLAAILLLDWPDVAFIVLAIHVTEWVRRQRPWYIQLYNVATYLLSAGAAALILGLSRSDPFTLNVGSHLLLAICAAGVFLLVNHAFTAASLRLARAVSYADSSL